MGKKYIVEEVWFALMFCAALANDPYRKGPEIPESRVGRCPESRVGRCPECNAPGVELHPYEYPEPGWDDDSFYGSPPCPPPILIGWRCGLCIASPQDPRKAICYVGNLILKELAKIGKA